MKRKNALIVAGKFMISDERSNDELLFGLILNGGKSSRMGSDKGMLNFHGQNQRQYLRTELMQLCSRVFISCKSPTDIVEGFDVIPDKFEIDTPLNGILSAFTTHPFAAWLTVPVDMPEVSSKTLALLLNERDRNCIATCFADSDGKDPEPLVALWEPGAVEPMRKFLGSGGVSVRRLLMQFKAKVIPSPGPSFHANINSPKDLERYLDNRTSGPG